MKKTLSIIISCLVASSLFAGCGQSSSASKSEAADSNKSVTLRFSWWGGDTRAKATLAVIDQFQKKYPNIKIKAEYGGSDGYDAKISTQLSSGTAPDIMQLTNASPQIFNAQGADYFVDLTKNGFDFSKFDKDYLAKANNGNCNGVQVGVPTGVAGSAFVINKELAEKAGVSNINTGSTWDDLIEAGKKVNQYDPKTYLLCMNTDYIINTIFKPYINQTTGNNTFADDKNKKLIVTKDQLQKGLQLVQDLYKNKVVPPASYSAAYNGDKLQTDPNWIAGKYVSSIVYISTLGVMTAANKSTNYIVGDLPVVKKGELLGWNTNCPQVMTVNKKSENVNEAVKFMNYFFNDQTAMETLGTERSVPPTAEARKLLADKGKMDPLLQQSSDISMKNKGVVADHWSESPEGLAAFQQAVESIGYGTSDPAKAAANLYNLLNGLVSQ